MENIRSHDLREEIFLLQNIYLRLCQDHRSGLRGFLGDFSHKRVDASYFQCTKCRDAFLGFDLHDSGSPAAYDHDKKVIYGYLTMRHISKNDWTVPPYSHLVGNFRPYAADLENDELGHCRQLIFGKGFHSPKP